MVESLMFIFVTVHGPAQQDNDALLRRSRNKGFKMKKFELLNELDNLTSCENQIRLSLPEEPAQEILQSSTEYNSYLQNLILLSLPTPSQHLH